jgi:hypothetical protein
LPNTFGIGFFLQLRHPLLLEKVVAGWGYGSLGGWVSVQRRNEAKLSPERLAKLERFVWDALDAFWDEGFTHLQQYVAEHGHAKVPATHKVDGFRLGQWVGVQRKNKDQLSPERLAKLESRWCIAQLCVFPFIWNGPVAV